jgi:hypothetical protein
MNKQNLKILAQGVLVAAAGGALGAVSDPHAIVANPDHAIAMGKAGAFIGVVGWIVKSPFQNGNGK